MVITDADDPLLYQERWTYLGALGRAVESIEAARATAPGAAQRVGAPPSGTRRD